jgi:hypothetical protein
MERIPQSDLNALKQRVVMHIREFCKELFPDGRLAPSGQYWIVTDRDFRISLSTGYFWNIAGSGFSKKPNGDCLTLWLIAKNLLVKKAQTEPKTNLESIRARLESAGRFGAYRFPNSDSFRQGVESLIEWLDERFPVRSDLHVLVDYDS